MMKKSYSQTEKKLDEMFLEITAQNILILSSEIYKKFYKGLKTKNCYYASCIKDDSLGVLFDLGQWPFREKYFDLIVLDFHLSLAVELDLLFLEVSKKLAENGELIIIDSGKLNNKKSIKNFSLTVLMNKLNNQGFERNQHYYISDNKSLLYKFLTCLFPWLCTTFILHYVKKIIPMRPIGYSNTEKLFEKKPICIPVGSYNKINKK